METSNTPAGVEALMALADEMSTAIVKSVDGPDAVQAYVAARAKLRAALESLAGGAQPVAELIVDEQSRSIHLLFNDNTEKVPHGKHDLYLGPPLSAGEAVAREPMQPVVQWGPILDALDGLPGDVACEVQHLSKMLRAEHRKTLAVIDANRASGEAVAQPVNCDEVARWLADMGDCPELNLSNYNADDVANLNAWAIVASGTLTYLSKYGCLPAPLPASPHAPVGDKPACWKCGGTGKVGNDDCQACNPDAHVGASGAPAAAPAGKAPSDEQDAKRYRWLRDKSEPGICAFYLSVGQAFKGVRFAKETVDEAIDAQINGLPSPAGSEGER